MSQIAEGMCQGAEDEHGNSMCDGPDIRKCRAQATAREPMFEVEWCAECRMMAQELGYVVFILSPEKTNA